MKTEHFIQSLLEQTKKNISQVEKLKSCDLPTLKWRETETSWNILECLEHLNLYGDFYLPQIEHKIKSSTTIAVPDFESGILGSYFAKSILPKEKLNKMNTSKDKNPLNTSLDKSVIDRFITQQIKLLELLNQSKNVNLNRIKIQTSISKYIKLKLGDAFQFLINHIIRHLNQIDKIQKAMKNA